MQPIACCSKQGRQQWQQQVHQVPKEKRKSSGFDWSFQGCRARHVCRRSRHIQCRCRRSLNVRCRLTAVAETRVPWFQDSSNQQTSNRTSSSGAPKIRVGSFHRSGKRHTSTIGPTPGGSPSLQPSSTLQPSSPALQPSSPALQPSPKSGVKRTRKLSSFS